MPAISSILPGFFAAVIFLFGLGPQAALGAPGEGGADWQATPARWLMEPAELRAWRNLASAGEAVVFLKEFWRRRDPDLDHEGNPRLELFRRRTAEANALFDGEGEPGSLTHRGRTYLLIGPPSALRQSYRRAPALGALAVRGRKSPQTRPLLVETWTWRPEDIGPRLRGLLKKRGWKLDLEVQFQVDRGSYSLLAGEDLLRLAARSWLRENGEK